MKNLYLIAIIILMSGLYTQAQSGCGEGNPISSNEWLQNQQTSIINSASLGIECTGGYIQEYIYNGEPVIFVYQECMMSSGVVYNCEGQFLCFESFDVSPDDQCVNFNQAEFVTQWWSYSCLCTDNYDPVCVDGNILFENACLADCAGYNENDWVAGECDLTPPTVCEFEDPLTDLEWLAELTGNSNCCFENQVSELAAADGNTYFYVVPSAGSATCPTDIPAVLYDCEGETICTYGFFGVTEECLDLLNSGELALLWECDGCNCTTEYNPVCVGETNYNNACEAECDGFFNWVAGECGCNCTTEIDPVCVNDSVTYNNSCEAECDGFFDWVPGECVDACADLAFSTALQGCGGDCGCDNLLELSAVGGDGNYTFTLADGQVVTDGFNVTDITNLGTSLEITLTDGQACTMTTVVDIPLNCCDVAPCAEVLDIFANCDGTSNCVLMVNLSANNSCEIEILDQSGNAYTAGQELVDGTYNFTAYTEGAGGDDCAALGTYEVTVENPIIDAIEDFDHLQVVIYPNPTDGIFNLAIQGNWVVQIYSIEGALIMEQSNNTTFDLSAVAKGLYLVKLSNEEGSLVKKLMIK